MIDFPAAFHALTNHTPLPWQGRLFDDLVAGRVPTALDLPTGLGKTSVIPIWLVARAAGAQLPRRLVFVVDRRAVVDQATEVASSIAGVIGDGAGATDTVQALREGLGLTSGVRIPVSTLRGQFVDNREWLEDPARPAIVVGTVDMIGSRLLFQGYGVSTGMRPVHAGLLGADALIALDEAHLVPPFEHLLRSVAAWPSAAGVPPFRLLTLSATGRTQSTQPFRLTGQDVEDERTSKRLRATKRVKLEDASGDLGEALAQRALERAGEASRVIVFCNSRKTAQKVKERLAASFGKSASPIALLVGARRVWERARLTEDPVFRRFLSNQTASDAPGPAFLVATSAGEVGVDLDADHLVMDLVPWERMVQRLGRVNRRAKPGESLVDVLVATPDKEAESGAIDGAEEVQRWRTPFEFDGWAIDAEGRRDASPLTLLQLRSNEQFAALASAACSPEPLHPELTGPVLEAWAMTSLDEHSGRAEVAPWLRGWTEDELQTRLVWRRSFPLRVMDLDDRATRIERLKRFFSVAGPHLSETLDVPTYQAVDLLRKRFAAYNQCGSDALAESRMSSAAPIAVTLDRKGEPADVIRAEEIENLDVRDLARMIVGRTVVLDARLGGLDPEGLLDEKHAEPPATIDAEDGAAVEPWREVAGFRVRQFGENEHQQDADWPIAARFDLTVEGDGTGDELIVEVLRRSVPAGEEAAVARHVQVLGEHHEWTANEARRIARALNLSPEYEGMLVAAGAVHDAGKARALWQNAMLAPNSGRPYAKTRGGGDYRALMLNGAVYRHEFGSVGDAEQDEAFSHLPEELRELALHLVAAHHGYGRPVIAPLDPELPPSRAVERARTIALRYHRMQREWGVWGLAWWEALLRAADWAASRKNNDS